MPGSALHLSCITPGARLLRMRQGTSPLTSSPYLSSEEAENPPLTIFLKLLGCLLRDLIRPFSLPWTKAICHASFTTGKIHGKRQGLPRGAWNILFYLADLRKMRCPLIMFTELNLHFLGGCILPPELAGVGGTGQGHRAFSFEESEAWVIFLM